MKVRGKIPKEEIGGKGLMETDAYLIAWDPDKRKIVGEYHLGESYEFEMEVDATPENINKILFLWQCASGTVMNQLHPEIYLRAKKEVDIEEIRRKLKELLDLLGD